MSALDRLPGTFSYSEALAAGMNHHRLYSLRDTGELEQIGRGMFRKADADLADLDLIEAARRAPQATICLLSALVRHELTDAIPGRYDLALPRGEWWPRVSPAIRWHSFDLDTFEIGRSLTPVDGEISIGLYDAPRTIIDAYRMRAQLGADTANEALKRWLRRGGQPADLLAMAADFPRARPSIRAALEILL